MTSKSPSSSLQNIVSFSIHSRTLNRPKAFPSLSAFDLAFAAFPAILRQKGTHPSPKSDLEQIQAAANGVLPLQYELWLAVAEVPYVPSSTSNSTSASSPSMTPTPQTQSIIVGRISANVTGWSPDSGYVGFFEVDTAFPEYEQVGIELLKTAVDWLRLGATTAPIMQSPPTTAGAPTTNVKGKKKPNPKSNHSKKTTTTPTPPATSTPSSQAVTYAPRKPVSRIFGPVNFSTFFNYRLRTDDGFDSFGHWEPDNPALYVEIFKKVNM
jgi:hypothetical protein